MKKSPILVLSVAVLMLCGCNNGKKPNSEVSSNSNELMTTNSNLTTNEGGNTSATTSMNQGAALSLFSEALKKDYTNLTLMSYQAYDDGEQEELDYEFIVGNDIVDWAYSLQQAGMLDGDKAYTHYHIDEEGKSWCYFEADSSNPNSKGGWLNKGYKNADLSIWNPYFYLPFLLENISVNDIAYGTGLYYIKDTKKVSELNQKAFSYYFEAVKDICFTLEDGYINKIYAFCDDMNNPVNYVEIKLFDFGVTKLPSASNSVPAFSETTKSTYWEYKGWPQDYEEGFYDSVDVKLSEGQEITSNEDFNVVLELDKSFEAEVSTSPDQFDPWFIVAEESKVITWHYDETILEMKNSYVSGHRVFRAIGSGETEVYASMKGKNNTQIESARIKVKVNALPQQDKTDAKFDFVFANIGTEYVEGSGYDVTVVNNVSSTKVPFTVKAGPATKLLDGKNSDLFESGKQYLSIDPITQENLNKSMQAGVYFDLGEQQVSKLSFNYGMFYANHMTYKDRLSQFVIRTSNDGVNFEEHDVAQEIKDNISPEFIKLMEVEFAPASIVQIVAKGTTIGNSLSLTLDSLCMFSNDECHNYVAPEDVHVESVTVSPSEVSMYEGRTTNLVAAVAPMTAFDPSLTWHVEEGKEGIVSVSSTGVVTSLSEGVAKVWATSNDGNIKSNEVTITVTKMPSLTSYVGNLYKDDNISLSIIDEVTAKVVGSNYEIEASLEDVVVNGNDTKFTMKNAQGESFVFLFSYNKEAHVSEIKYLKDGELKELTATYYCKLQVFMTSFNVKVGSLTANASGKYDVFQGDTTYLSISSTTPSDANRKGVVYTSSNTSIATVEENGKVTFVGQGEVTIKVASVDNENVYKEITFVVAGKVYPTENNWTLTADKETVSVGQEAHLTTQFDANINTSTTVTFSSSDTKIATVDRNGVITGKKEGVVTISASVTGENGTVTKSVEITVVAASEDEVLPSSICGTWSGEDYYGSTFTFTVNGNGTAILEDGYGGSMDFTFDRKDGAGFNYFIGTDSDGQEFTIVLKEDSSSWNFELEDSMYILDLMFLEVVNISK